MAAESGDSWHVQGILRELGTPEAIATSKQEHADQAAMIVAAVGCSDCFARRGEPCKGLASGFHYGRGLNYVRKG